MTEPLRDRLTELADDMNYVDLRDRAYRGARQLTRQRTLGGVAGLALVAAVGLATATAWPSAPDGPSGPASPGGCETSAVDRSGADCGPEPTRDGDGEDTTPEMCVVTVGPGASEEKNSLVVWPCEDEETTRYPGDDGEISTEPGDGTESPDSGDGQYSPGPTEPACDGTDPTPPGGCTTPQP